MIYRYIVYIYIYISNACQIRLCIMNKYIYTCLYSTLCLLSCLARTRVARARHFYNKGYGETPKKH